MTLTLNHYLFVSGLLFAIGLSGVMLRRNIIIIFMCLELMLNAVNLTLVAYNRLQPQNHTGQILAFFVITVAAAEAAVGLAIVLAFFRVRRSVRSDDADILRN